MPREELSRDIVIDQIIKYFEEAGLPVPPHLKTLKEKEKKEVQYVPIQPRDFARTTTTKTSPLMYPTAYGGIPSAGQPTNIGAQISASALPGGWSDIVGGMGYAANVPGFGYGANVGAMSPGQQPAGGLNIGQAITSGLGKGVLGGLIGGRDPMTSGMFGLLGNLSGQLAGQFGRAAGTPPAYNALTGILGQGPLSQALQAALGFGLGKATPYAGPVMNAINAVLGLTQGKNVTSNLVNTLMSVLGPALGLTGPFGMVAGPMLGAMMGPVATGFSNLATGKAWSPDIIGGLVGTDIPGPGYATYDYDPSKSAWEQPSFGAFSTAMSIDALGGPAAAAGWGMAGACPGDITGAMGIDPGQVGYGGLGPDFADLTGGMGIDPGQVGYGGFDSDYGEVDDWGGEESPATETPGPEEGMEGSAGDYGDYGDSDGDFDGDFDGDSGAGGGDW